MLHWWNILFEYKDSTPNIQTLVCDLTFIDQWRKKKSFEIQHWKKEKIPDLKKQTIDTHNLKLKVKKPWIIPKTLVCPLHSHNHKTKEKTFQRSEIETVWKSHGRCSHVYFTNICFISNISNCFIHIVCVKGSLLSV